MRYRLSPRVILALIVLVVMVSLSGCREWFEPKPRPLPTPEPSPTATLAAVVLTTPSAAPTPTLVRAEVIAPPQPQSVVPILYKMFDWGTDFQKEHPEWGPVGSIQFVLWEQIDTGPDEYNWSVIDRKLALEAPLRVTLPDGRQIPKPVVIQVMAHLSSYPDWTAAEYYDGTPGWVYDQIDAANPGSPRPVVQGHKVGYVLEGCGRKTVLPMYDNPIWQEAHYKMIRAFGQRYNGHAQVTSTVINTGLDGETQPVKDLNCSWNKYLDEQAGNVRYSFGKFMDQAMVEYRRAFPDKVIYINHAPAGSGGRKVLADRAATFSPPIGLKHAGMWVDLDSHQGYGDFTGSWDMVRAYSATLPIWLESPFGLGGKEQRYWSLIAGLHYHPDAIDLHPEYFTQSDPEWLRFTVAHLGVTLDNTPDVWTVLRDSEFPLQSWGKGGVSGHVGDWSFWLYRLEKSPESRTQIVLGKDLPAAKEHVYSRQVRRTIQSERQLYMDFNIDDGYPYVNHKPIDVPGGDVYYRVHVTILNTGGDTFALQYRNAQGETVSQVRRKGASLGRVDDWVTVTFTVTDGLFNNNLPGSADLRISCQNDGDEYVHMVRVQGGWGVPPTLTPTLTPSITPRVTMTPTPTRKPDQGGPPANVTPTPMQGALRFDPGEDTYLDEWEPTANPYSSAKLYARQGGVKVPLLKFDLAAIPADVEIARAVLQLYVLGRSNTGVLDIQAYKVVRDWNEQEATWKDASRGAPWAVAGCRDPVQDRSAVVVAQTQLNAPAGWYELDLTDLVRDWVNHGAANEGLVLSGTGLTSVQYELGSANHSDSNIHPRLWVAYAPSTATPTVEIPTATATETHLTPSPTQTSGPPPAETMTSTPEASVTPTETATRVPLHTPTSVQPTVTGTPLPFPSPSETSVYPLPPTETLTPAPSTATPIPSATAAETFTPLPGATPMPPPSLTPSVLPPTLTRAPSVVPSATRTSVPTAAQPTPTLLRLREGENYVGVADTFLDSWDESARRGGADTMVARQGSVRVPLLRFDLASIPDLASVKRASLHVYTTGRDSDGVLHLSVARVNRFWDPVQVTWRQATASQSWAQPGARELGTDRSSQTYASAALDAERAWVAWDITSLVQEWVSDPQQNYGLLLLAEGSAAMQYELAASETGTTEHRPYMEIEYIAIHPSPTPTAMAPVPASPTARQPTATMAPTGTSTPMGEATVTPATPTETIEQVRVVLQEGLASYQGVADTYLDAWNQTAAHGDSRGLIVRQPNHKSVIIRYDLAAIPSSAIIKDAYLTLWASAVSNREALCLEVYMLRRPWGEDSATWIDAEKGGLWAGAGAGSPQQDYEPGWIDALSIAGAQKWVQIDVSTAMQYWVRHPDENWGLLIRGVGSDDVEYEFASSEWDTRQQRPKLLLTYGVDRTPQQALPDQTRVLLQAVGVATGAVAVALLLAAGSKFMRGKRKQERK